MYSLQILIEILPIPRSPISISNNKAITAPYIYLFKHQYPNHKPLLTQPPIAQTPPPMKKAQSPRRTRKKVPTTPRLSKSLSRNINAARALHTYMHTRGASWNFERAAGAKLSKPLNRCCRARCYKARPAREASSSGARLLYAGRARAKLRGVEVGFWPWP